MSTEEPQTLKDCMVDVVLEFNNTPRRHLFEYPYRADESRTILAAAEDVVDQVLALSGNEPPVVEEQPVRLRPTWLDGKGF